MSSNYAGFVQSDRPLYMPGNPLAPSPGTPPTEPAAHFVLAFDSAAEGGRPPRKSQASRAAAAPGAISAWWHNQYWITPSPADFGNITGYQEIQVTIFSSFREDHALETLDLSSVQPGVAVAEGSAIAPPAAIVGYGTIVITLAAEEDGLAIFNELIPFEFDNRTQQVQFRGQRVAAWTIEPNWIEPLLERQLWKTDVIEAEDSSEQRIALRGACRIEWEFTFDVSASARRRHENLIYRRGAGVWLVPVFSDFAQLDAELPAGAIEIPLALTHDLRFEPGGSAMLFHGGRTETVTIEAVTSNGLLLAGDTIDTWPQGTKVYPAHLARMQDPRQTAAMFQNYGRGTALFRTLREITGEALAETTYRGEPVLEIEPNWIEAPTIDYGRKLFEFDPGTGRDFVLDLAEVPLPRQVFRWLMLERADADMLRAWCYARRGRFKGLWVPTFTEDLELKVLFAASGTTMTIENAGVDDFGVPDVHRRDLRIELHSGSVYYRRITAVSAIDADSETVTLDTSLPVDVAPEDVARISWMHYARLDHDAIEISWITPSTVELTVTFKGPKNDV